MKAYWIPAAILLAAVSAPAGAQTGGGDQAAAVELRHALERLAKRPTDSDALLDAGNAALILRDYDSALGFFSRAESLQPSSGRVKSGLATAQLYSENPVEALKLYDQAIALGVNERSIAADRGLAFDLVGNNALAQSEYALGSTAVSTDDLIIRQAVSFGLAGDQKRADALLNPLLSQNKPGAWRARAFILAAHGDVQEATRIVRGFLDARSTAAMQAYLERMSDLTKAQQAAVIHYGHFPAEQQVGRDSEAVRAIASRGYVGRAATGAQDQGLIPTGEPLGRRGQAKADKPATRTARAIRTPTERPERETRRAAAARAKSAAAQGQAVPVPAQTTPVSVAGASAASLPAAAVASPADMPASFQSELAAILPPTAATAGELASGTLVSESGELPAIAQPAIAIDEGAAAASPGAVPPETVSGSAEPAAPDAAPGFASLGNVRSVEASSDYGPPASAGPTGTASLADSSIAPAAAGTVPSLNQIVRAIDIPPEEKQSNVFAADLERLQQYKDAKPLGPVSADEPAPFASVKAVPQGAKALGASPAKTEAAAAPVKAPAAADEPARNWVQIATGGVDAMKSEYRRLSRGKPELFKGQKGWTSPFKTQARLLVGPFDTLGEARDWLGEYVEAGGDGFAWNSEAGTVVAPLP